VGELLFFVAGVGAIGGAIGVVVLRNAFYSVLALVSHLLCLAALFLLLLAEFVAAAQVVVYAGAVMVLYVFVVAYVGGTAQELSSQAVSARMRFASVLFAGVLFAELAIAILSSGLTAIDTQGPVTTEPGFGTPARIGELLLTKFLLPFEAASFLLLIAAVGAVVLARRRGGLEDEEDERKRVSLYDVLRPAETGTMAEAVGSPFSLTPSKPEDRP
jgi:NADH:ubiquinone oxidoreductase subunit 6 (subunit J)